MKLLYLGVVTGCFMLGWWYGWAQTKWQMWSVGMMAAYMAGAIIRFNWLHP